ncbi:MAG: AAA family ATPase, partial [Halobacteriales archaeon]
MRLERLELTNFRCYESATVEFDEGVTVVQGGNGAGKTSLLKACFVALYGSDALDSGENLADVVTKGKEETRVRLEFVHAGDAYSVEQEIAMTGTGDDRRATTRKSVLTRNGEAVGDDGVRSTREEVERLLRMDADAFVNCAYVRQGEVNKLIEASPDERRRVVDELLQLGRLETYRERAD